MKIRVIWVGRTKEKFMAEGIKAYLRKLGPFARVSVTEIKEQKGAGPDESVRQESERILKQAGNYILLDETGRHMSSTGFAAMLKDRPGAEFVLGGAYGVSEEVKENAAETIALSNLTLTHDMARLVLLEQLYRAIMINSGRGYHH